ncbi:c-type cytochrome [Sinorhizobium mexicanum]|uniref:Cytochrome c family protein n=1 Tax=Sinorhizobium mexicanum TaxID=375549 RepID=A0A859QN62_9HYPH|nr:cytochrome c family protein [Sinorhizobium mexicanum]MBP1888318.1 cytochrome c [Sinorhizobium mexicanum]QLL64140.1 cytochrome c family protein [Sinorhizobium mexicanum]
MKFSGRIGPFIAVLTLVASIVSPGYAQDAGRGESVFKACAACHTTDDTNRVGPGLGGIIGKKAGAATGFRYSSAMKNSGIVWDEKTLDAFLESPQKAVPGTRMPYAGLKDTTDRADLIGYLATFK